MCTCNNHANWLRFLFLVKKVFKLDPNSKGGPLLTLGRSMQPGSDQNHFCQPTDVAVDPDTGTIYVSDGYCNSRIVQFSPTGNFITQWGEGNSIRLLISDCYSSPVILRTKDGHPSHSWGYNCTTVPCSGKSRASVYIQLAIFLYTPTHSLARRKMNASTQKCCPNREKVHNAFVGKRYYGINL